MSGDILLCFYTVLLFFICVFQKFFVPLHPKIGEHGNAYFSYRGCECRFVGNAE